MVVPGIIGANGAGKSTLFKMLMGKEQPDSGSLTIGETVKTMYVDQSRESLSSDRFAAFAAADAVAAFLSTGEKLPNIVDQLRVILVSQVHCCCCQHHHLDVLC